MSLEGLRAWIGEVERKLGMRTRVFLVLSVLALGGAGAAIYLAIDARDSSVSESDVQALQEDLEGQIGSGGDSGAEVDRLEAELNALKAEVEALERKEDGGSQKGGGADGGTNGGASSGSSEEQPPAKPSAGASGDASNSAKLQELIEQAQEENAQAEREQDGK